MPAADNPDLLTFVSSSRARHGPSPYKEATGGTNCLPQQNCA